MPVTTSETYGSNTYESLVLSGTPTALFGPYASATNSISDLTNNNYLTASFTSASSFQRQIPFFALPGDDYTFEVTPSNKLVIKENTSVFPRSIGAGRFASGDEDNNFSIEFLLSHNHSLGSSNDFARFGINSSQHSVGISYENLANQFYLTVYSQDGIVRYRSVVEGGHTRISKHIVLKFNGGIPSLYVNGTEARELINELNGENTFFSNKAAGRTVAEFSTGSDSQKFLVSMLAFYDYSISNSIIASHYYALFDIGNFKQYISAYGSPLLYENIPFNEKISRNDGDGQDFSGAAGINTSDLKYLSPNYWPNFTPYGTGADYLERTTLASGYGVIPSGGFSFRSTDMGSYLSEYGITLLVKGGGTGSYTSETPLLFVTGTSVGDFYVSIDSASSKVIIGSGSNTVLASTSSYISQDVQASVTVTTAGSAVYVSLNDGVNAASYAFDNDIIYYNPTVYAFNRYYFDENSSSAVSVGNALIDFSNSQVGDGTLLHAYLSDTYLNSASKVVWTPSQRTVSESFISLPSTIKEYNYLRVNQSSDATSLELLIDGASAQVQNDSIISIPSTSSNVLLKTSMTSKWNGSMYDSLGKVWIKDIILYNFAAASYAAGGYPAVIQSSSGIINSQDDFLNIFRQPNIGFMQTAGNVISIINPDEDSNGISQIDFLISLPVTLSASSQTLIHYQNTASMGLSYNSSSDVYLISFMGMTASINSYAAVSGSSRMYPRQIYFVQASLSTSVPTGSSIYVFSASDGSKQFQHAFDRLSVFPSSSLNARPRYAQVFGTRNVKISDTDLRGLRVESLPDDTLLLNKSWQIYQGQ